MRFIVVFAAMVFAALGMAEPASGAASGREAYLFEKNKAAFPDIGQVRSRSFKFLAAFDQSANMLASMAALRDRVIQAGTAAGYAFAAPKKGWKWAYSAKCYYDTPERDLYDRGYVIREIYPYKRGKKPDPDKFFLTVKEMSPDDFARLARSELRPASGGGVKIKFEENISLAAPGVPRSYFESTVSASAQNRQLGNRALGDYAALYPALAHVGLAADTVLTPPVIAWSVESVIGRFALPGGQSMKLTMEGWARSRGGPPILIGIDMDVDGDTGYSEDPAKLRAAEDFFMTVFGGALGDLAMPGSGGFMGSKVRILFDRARER